MERKVCIDTDVVIAILNGEERASKALDKIVDDEVYISAITLFELMLRKTNLDAVERFQGKVDILPFDELAAREASEILKELKRKGKPIDMRDIFTASACSINGCSLLTFNTKHFNNINSVSLV